KPPPKFFVNISMRLVCIMHMADITHRCAASGVASFVGIKSFCFDKTIRYGLQFMTGFFFKIMELGSTAKRNIMHYLTVTIYFCLYAVGNDDPDNGWKSVRAGFHIHGGSPFQFKIILKQAHQAILDRGQFPGSKTKY